MSLAVVIPVVDEERRIERCLADLDRQTGIDERIVVDGGSVDRTVQRARAFAGVEVIEAPRGRGPQLNAGADASSADVLLFLHADVTLPPNAAAIVAKTLADRAVVAGAFRTWTVPEPGRGWWPGPLLHLADLRSRYSRLPYGDQALFVRRQAFVAAGGFPDQVLMEDLELSRRLRRLGRIAIVGNSVTVSGRRFQDRLLRQTLWVNLFPLLYAAGVAPETLARLYGAPR